MTRQILQPWTNFYVQSLHFRIVQVEYRGQTRYAKILDSKTSIDTYYWIPLVASSNPTCKRPCGVTWDSVPEQNLFLNRRGNKAAANLRLSSYSIRHHDRLELKYPLLAQFSLNLIEQLINLRKERTENLKIRTDQDLYLWDRIIDGWSIWLHNAMHDDSIRNMLIWFYALFYSDTNEWSKDWAHKLKNLAKSIEFSGSFHIKKNLSSVTECD